MRLQGKWGDLAGNLRPESAHMIREPSAHDRGVVASEPGLYFVGLFFLYAGSSALLRGVGRDAERIVKAIGSRVA
jgi:hypothetical protein